MVRLLQLEQEGLSYDEAPFNPTMVRLLRKRPCSAKARVENFQSHNGAIAAVVTPIKVAAPNLNFQSHNGAIAAW